MNSMKLETVAAFLAIAFYSIGLIKDIRETSSFHEYFFGPVPFVVLIVVIGRLVWRGTQTDRAIAGSKQEKAQLESQLAIATAELNDIRPLVAVFLPNSPTQADSFWMEFSDAVRSALQEKNYQPDIRTLKADYSGQEQISELRRFRWDSVKAAIVSPADNTVIPELVKILQGLGTNRRPVVVHDMAPDEARRAFSGSNLSVNIVCVDNERGGWFAADTMLAYWKDKNLSPPYKVVLVPGNKNHPHSRLRLSGFKSRMEEARTDVRYYPTPDGGWTYQGAYRAMMELLDNEQELKECAAVHGIFACNDEMAIAVEDALANAKHKHPAFQETRIVGFDYTFILRHAWKRKQNGLIFGTVNAMVGDQASKASDLIAELISGQTPWPTDRIVVPAPVIKA